MFEVAVAFSGGRYSGLVVSLSSLFPKGRPILCSMPQASRIVTTTPTCRRVELAISSIDAQAGTVALLSVFQNATVREGCHS